MIFEISHNGEHCTAGSVTSYRTEDYAVMNVSACQFDPQAQKTIIAVGHNEKCQTYALQLARDTSTPDPGAKASRKECN